MCSRSKETSLTWGTQHKVKKGKHLGERGNYGDANVKDAYTPMWLAEGEKGVTKLLTASEEEIES